MSKPGSLRARLVHSMSAPDDQPRPPIGPAGGPTPTPPTPGRPMPTPVAVAEEALGRADRAYAGISSTLDPRPGISNGDSSQGVAHPGERSGLRMLDDVDLDVRIELGRTRMLVEDVLRLGADSVVELDKAAGDPVDIYVNGRHIARGEVLVVNENFCVRVSEILEPLDRGGGATKAP